MCQHDPHAIPTHPPKLDYKRGSEHGLSCRKSKSSNRLGGRPGHVISLTGFWSELDLHALRSVSEFVSKSHIAS
jgi:hypothetical protein